MKRFQFLFPMVFLVLVAGIVLSGCKTTGTSSSGKSATATQAKAQTDPMADLEGRMFLLPDGRDMSYAVSRVTRLGVDVNSVREAAQHLRFADFRSYLNEVAGAHRVVYVGGGKLRVEVLQYTLGEEYFEDAVFFMHLTKFKTEGTTISGVILDKTLLAGRDFTVFAGLKVYERLLEIKSGL